MRIFSSRFSLAKESLLSPTLWRVVFFLLLCFVEFQPVFAERGVVPKTPILSLNGYFRFRGDLFKNMDLGVSPTDLLGTSIDPRLKTGFPYLRPLTNYTQNNHLLTDQTPANFPDLLGSGNMRFRLQMTLSASESVFVHATLDFLDNLVLGSSPYSVSPFGLLGPNFLSPVEALANIQRPPSIGSNLLESIKARHLYAEVKTPIGYIQVGRMPNHWGLGMMNHAGMNFDSEYGDTADRIKLILELFGFTIAPALDISTSGPSNARFFHGFGQAVGFMGDDALQFQLTALYQDVGAKLRDKKENGDWIINGGVHYSYRTQQYTTECPIGKGTCTNSYLQNSTQIQLYNRNLNVHTPDIWFRVLKGEKFRLELEVAFVIGSMEGGPVYDPKTKDSIPVDIFQYAFALEMDYKFLDGDLTVGLNFGLASGGNHMVSKWGIMSDSFSQRDPVDGRAKWNTFLFNPDYQIDMILWREIYGAVNNAFYAKAHLTYNILSNPWEDNGLAIRAAGIYSMAMNSKGTLGLDGPLGVELNALLYYASSDGFIASFSYGVLFPLPGMDYAVFDNPNEQTGRNVKIPAEIAHRFWFKLGIRF